MKIIKTELIFLILISTINCIGIGRTDVVEELKVIIK